MKSFFNLTLLILIQITIPGQTVIEVDQQGMPRLTKLGDTVIYKVITQTKDTFDFGIDERTIIQDTGLVIYNSLKINNKFVEIDCYGNGVLLMSINLQSLKNWDDTVAVYNLLDPTFITRFVIIKKFSC